LRPWRAAARFFSSRHPGIIEMKAAVLSTTSRAATVVRFAAFALTMALLGCGSSSNGETPSGADASVDAAAEAAAPITGLTQGQWVWVPIEGALCRDGSSTGIGVNLGSKSDKLMIFLEGGGACFNDQSCGYLNPSQFGSTNFTTQVVDAEGKTGIFDRTASNNPVADWNFVYIPYCTGDIHSGNNVTGADAGSASISNQHFVGYANVGIDLQRIVPTFPGLSQVLLTGISAGGFGAAANYVQVAKAFSPVPVFSLDDSGPPMEAPYTATCQQQQCADLWGLDKTILKDCGGDCTNPSSYQLDYAKHVGKAYPNVPFGLIESEQDMVITLFFGLGTNNGANDCNGTILTSESGSTFTMGLEDIRAKLMNSNFGSFIFGGNAHTSLLSNFTTNTRTSDGVLLTDWVSQLIAGKVTNVGLDATDGGADAAPTSTDDAASGEGGTDAGAD
jgi:hypothetical protein